MKIATPLLGHNKIHAHYRIYLGAFRILLVSDNMLVFIMSLVK